MISYLTRDCKQKPDDEFYKLISSATQKVIWTGFNGDGVIQILQSYL